MSEKHSFGTDICEQCGRRYFRRSENIDICDDCFNKKIEGNKPRCVMCNRELYYDNGMLRCPHHDRP